MTDESNLIAVLEAELEEATTEIETLSTELSESEKKVARLTAEVERLRAALSAIARNADCASDLPLFRVQARDFARAALEEK